ncbi:response regulator transcription factor [Nocardia gamkensis]|uniref:response regulator transcription factor n=1 Tax=Nocardia gamkensis TaxID=352869 RepID=UPI003404A1CA
MTIRVVIADDQALLVGTFRLLIDSTDDMKVVGVAGTGREAIAVVRATNPDVVLMDIRMPELDGLAATREICRDETLATRILILTTFELDEYVARALRAGACGFLGKDVGPQELLAAIQTIAAGDTLLSPAATRALIARFRSHPELRTAPAESLEVLTAREREVVVQVAEGLSNEEIAERMFVSPLTIRTHVQRAMTKLGARHRAQLVVIAFRTGLVRVEPPRKF